LMCRRRHYVSKESRQKNTLMTSLVQQHAVALWRTALCVSEWTDIRYSTFKKIGRLVIENVQNVNVENDLFESMWQWFWYGLPLDKTPLATSVGHSRHSLL